nr:unnamed protein product [Callosobruchus analis]
MYFQEVDCATYSGLLGQGSVLVNVDNCDVYDALGLKICFKCCGLNHYSKDCKKSEQICIKCAGNHKVSKCNSAQLKCMKVAVKSIVTINGIINVFKELENHDVNFLRCRRLNQDPIDLQYSSITVKLMTLYIDCSALCIFKSK